MNKTLLIFICLFTSAIYCYSQTNKTDAISFNGMYIANTGSIAKPSMDVFTYLRFYKDGTVYLTAVNSNDLISVSKWFGRYKTFSQKGKYQIDGTTISFRLNNKESEDFKLEGLVETTFQGTIKPDNQICLTRNTKLRQFCFDFKQVDDTTIFKHYAEFKPELKLPGEWKVKQILKGNGQIFFTNDDSTVIGITVFKTTHLPVYKETQTQFETVLAYYKWDADYMQNDEKMEVKKIAENKEKNFIVWNAKDKNNDNYFLFAKHNSLLYNIMVYDKTMPLEKKIKWLETLYDLNKE